MGVSVRAFAALGLLICGTGWGEGVPAALRDSIEQAVARVTPALVRIHVVDPHYSEGREIKNEASGSGVIVTKEGHVVTNHHVAGDAVRVFCTLSDKEEIEAEIVGTDALTDIAVIKLKTDGLRTFSAVPFGDSGSVKVGDTVLAMGCPMALSQSVTAGIVSNVEMIMPEWLRAWGDLKEDGEDVGALVKWIGHDAAIAGGNSGGPLVNLGGEIIGINELRIGLAGAIPGNLVKSVSDEIIAHGKVVRAWLGATVQPRLKHAKETRGILVGGVVSGSPAAAAGLRGGDTIIRINGVNTDAQFAEQVPDFNRLVAALPIGREAEVVVLRDGAETSLRVTPVEREKAKLKEQELKEWGITACDLSLMAAKEMKRKTQDGVLVTSLRPGGAAGEAKPGIQEDDVIVEVDGKSVKNLREFQQVTEPIVKGKTDLVTVLVAFDRKTERYMSVAKVGLKELEDPGLEVKKAWLPCETQVITRNMADLLGRPALTGFRITEIYAGSTAEKAGLQTGDMILGVDGEKLTASAPEHYEELAALIRQYKVGDTVKLTVLRGKEETTIPVGLVLAPKLAREMKEYKENNFGFTVRDIGFFDKAKEQWGESQQGVLVSTVEPGGWAKLGRLGVGDLILSVDGTAVSEVVGFKKKMEVVAAAKPRFLSVHVLRGIYTLYLEFEPKWDTTP